MSPALVAFELVVGLTVAQRLAELVLSRRNLARLSTSSRAADSSANWSAMVVLQSLWLAGCALEPALRGTAGSALQLGLGLALFTAGAALRVWCIRTLGTWWNARGRVDPDLCVVSSGPYRFVRHPNYLGVLLELVGLPLAGAAWWTLALLGPPHVVVLWRRMRGEDQLLFRLPGYAERMAGKGALLPRLARR